MLAEDRKQIHTMLSSGLPVTPEDAVPVGATVQVTTGPLTGMVGKVIRRAKRDQFVAVVRFVGRGAMVNFQDWQVEIVAERSSAKDLTGARGPETRIWNLELLPGPRQESAEQAG